MGVLTRFVETVSVGVVGFLSKGAVSVFFFRWNLRRVDFGRPSLWMNRTTSKIPRANVQVGTITHRVVKHESEVHVILKLAKNINPGGSKFLFEFSPRFLGK